MVSYRNILFCTDFSDHARAALPFAVDLAKKYGSRLDLLHVYQEAGHIAEFELSSDGELGACEHEMVRGKPHVEIVRYAREKDIDLIVMGSHGLSGLKHVLFGSTAERVVRESPCNVFVVKRPAA
ncbi:MAG: universal stress protein [Syntrophorhabdales bacterium]